MSEARIVEVAFHYRASDDNQARAFEQRALGAGLHWDTFEFERPGRQWRGRFRLSDELYRVDGAELVEWLTSQPGVEDLEISGAAV